MANKVTSVDSDEGVIGYKADDTILYSESASSVEVYLLELHGQSRLKRFIARFLKKYSLGKFRRVDEKIPRRYHLIWCRTHGYFVDCEYMYGGMTMCPQCLAGWTDD